MSDIPAHYFHIALHSAKRKGLRPAAICKALNIDVAKLDDPTSTVTNQEFSNLWRYLWDAMDDEFLGFTQRPCKRGTFATACKLARRSTNFAHFFKEMTRFYTLVDSDIIMSLEAVDDKQALSVVNHAPSYDIQHFSIEYILFYWHRLSCWFSNQKIKPLYAEFAYPEPAHSEVYKLLFQCPIHFNRERNALIFNDNFKDLQPIRSRSELYDFLNSLPDDFLSIPGKDSSLETRIKILILKQSREHLKFPTLEQLADSLHMSRTSLGRKLAAENTSYRHLKELIRRDLTMDKLSRSNMNIADIAQLVGFSESASLNRAFKNWTGLTPQQFRGQKNSNAK
ncbi:AraC family transcriptional regulator [Dasania sp. GY-MA-18]|uniref:AraC family transcriptional regulator n=1 Tax=Dasania phycosphaerae TaxID=2950436 RepID=A0A9J6RNG8_9GAMM|nr:MULTISPECIES: AraC family transcriptional regulator [Dasania]MCR8923255.1 AraC family transcriptional regulator [Dasania sp. GY-MA-18]MCZ0865687.1 AraC family transcriptional regulator [Dasania phycosphaerae]MCZ0869412.1 AraC family transcriptional regulator [Dasania phycosphaerae]